jgi:PiT family inorganic phosphate transporter
MSPRAAVGLSAVLNFVGAFISLEVAATVAEDVVDGGAISETIVFAGLLGGIFWNLVTWRYGLPSSSSHALIGGIVGAALVAKGADAVKGDGVLGEVLIPALIAPVLAGAVAAAATYLVYRLSRRAPQDGVKRGFRFGQLARAADHRYRIA